jgi:hypothetical protein
MRRVFDPFDAAHSRDAWSELERLRAETPVADIASGMRYVDYVTQRVAGGMGLRDVAGAPTARDARLPGEVDAVSSSATGLAFTPAAQSLLVPATRL